MDEKTLGILEYQKILEKLASYAAFSVSAVLARALHPTNDLEQALLRQARTREARQLLSIHSNVGVDGARNVFPQLELARKSGVLEPSELLDIKNTLIVGRNLARTIENQEDSYPHLESIAAALPPPSGLVDAITRSISERGEVLDKASDHLASIRRDLKVAHERLIARLKRLINDPKKARMLQEPIITHRNGRYVIPLQADFKGRIRGITHDQSASGATLFIEPLVTVELNNQYTELQLTERDEERRILAELSSRIGQHADQIEDMLSALGEIDLALMCAKYAEDLHAAEPLLVPFRDAENDHPSSTLRLYQARHPLLDQTCAVPIDVYLDDQTHALVITGPNTGGKTVTLKTVGLLTLMALSGLQIPAQSGSTLSIFEDIFADIGDEQSIEQSLSTFSGHITNIIHVLEQANSRCLVLLDELGAGTDPQEGASLAQALLSYLVDRKITCLVATHFPELKVFAHNTPGVLNASMEFDLQTLRPTYNLRIGLPGRSNALLISERLGMPVEVIQTARASRKPEDTYAEDLLDDIQRQRTMINMARSAAEQARQEAEKIRSDLSTRLENIEDERISLLEEARSQAEDEITELRTELDEIRRALARVRQPLDEVKKLQEQVKAIEVSIEKPPRSHPPSQQLAPRPLRIGDKVRLRSLQLEGIVTALGESEVEIQAGTLRTRAHLSNIQRVQEQEEHHPASIFKTPDLPATRPSVIMHPSPSLELNLRGKRAEDALDALEPYLESAYLASMPFVRIIHGKGTGRLREVVRKALRHSTYVKNWATGKEDEGGDGVTVAYLDID